MALNAKYVHTNIVAQDWRNLAKFYQTVFGCIPVLPERDLSGQWIDDCTGVRDIHIRGMHLRLPGCGDNGPTLEIFQYNQAAERPETFINRPGFAHIAFAVDDVAAVEQAVLNAGGGRYGQQVNVDITETGHITVVYMTDPESNIIEIIELQCWSA